MLLEEKNTSKQMTNVKHRCQYKYLSDHTRFMPDCAENCNIICCCTSVKTVGGACEVAAAAVGAFAKYFYKNMMSYLIILQFFAYPWQYLSTKSKMHCR